MFRILHFNNSPGIQTASDFLSFDFQKRCWPANSEWHGILQLSHLLLVIFVFVRIAVGKWIDFDAVSFDFFEDALLKTVDFFLRENICFSNDGDNVDLRVKLLHEFNVQWFQSEDKMFSLKLRLLRFNLPVAEWWDEVEAAMDAVVDDVSTVQAAFITQESFILLIDIL